MASTNVMFREPPGTTGRTRHLSERETAPRTSEANVGQVERVASAALGGTLLLLGLGRARSAGRRWPPSAAGSSTGPSPGTAISTRRSASIPPPTAGRRPGPRRTPRRRWPRSRSASPPRSSTASARSADPDADHIRVRRGDARGRRPHALEGPGPARAGTSNGTRGSSRTGRAGVSAGSRSRARPCRTRARSTSAPRRGRPGHGGHPPHPLRPPGRGPRPRGREAPGLRAQAVRRAALHYFRPWPRPARSPPPTATGRTLPTPAEEDIPMRALYWNGVNDLRVETVADPTIVNPHDVILKVTLTTTCGSDLHFIDGYLPTMREGDVIGHEFMGEVVEVGPEVKKRQGGRPRRRPVLHRAAAVLVLRARPVLAVRQHATRRPSCRSRCSATRRPASTATPTPSAATPARTPSTSGCPSATSTASRCPTGVRDEQALFLSDAVPTGYMGADFCDIQPGDTVAVWGCGGVGLMAQRSALLLGAERVIAIDRLPERLRLARDTSARRPSTTRRSTASSRCCKEMTGGRGPDACIDAVGMEAHGTGIAARLRPREAGAAPGDRPRRRRCARRSWPCRKGGDRSRSSASTG